LSSQGTIYEVRDFQFSQKFHRSSDHHPVGQLPLGSESPFFVLIWSCTLFRGCCELFQTDDPEKIIQQCLMKIQPKNLSLANWLVPTVIVVPCFAVSYEDDLLI
jgi:hypothetical protein